MRNEIAHEYVLQELRDLFQRVKEYTPIVLTTVEKIRKYGEKLLK